MRDAQLMAPRIERQRVAAIGAGVGDAFGAPSIGACHETCVLDRDTAGVADGSLY
jgi:hypothetical protein